MQKALMTQHRFLSAALALSAAIAGWAQSAPSNLDSISRSKPTAFQAVSFQQVFCFERPPFTTIRYRAAAGLSRPEAVAIFMDSVEKLPQVMMIADGWAFQAAFSRNLNLPALAGSHQ
jgi:hypothetical protein